MPTDKCISFLIFVLIVNVCCKIKELSGQYLKKIFNTWHGSGLGNGLSNRIAYWGFKMVHNYWSMEWGFFSTYKKDYTSHYTGKLENKCQFTWQAYKNSYSIDRKCSKYGQITHQVGCINISEITTWNFGNSWSITTQCENIYFKTLNHCFMFTV